MRRKLFDGRDPFWSEEREFSRFEAWVDLIQLAAYHDHSVLVKGEPIQIERGQVIASQRFLAERWNWSTNKVRRFWSVLEELDRAEVDSNHPKNHLGSIITLVNYDKHQPDLSETNHQTNHRQTTHEPKPIRETRDKKEKNKQQGSLGVEANGTIKAVWNHYVSSYADRFSEGRANRLKLDSSGRLGKIKARLREGYTKHNLCRAIDGYFASEWHVERGKVELEYILRNQSTVEEGLTKADQAEERRDPHSLPGP